MNIILTRLKSTEISLDLIHASKVIVGCTQRHNTAEDVIPILTSITPPTLSQGVKGFLVPCQHGRRQTGREDFTNCSKDKYKMKNWLRRTIWRNWDQLSTAFTDHLHMPSVILIPVLRVRTSLAQEARSLVQEARSLVQATMRNRWKSLVNVTTSGMKKANSRLFNQVRSWN